MFKPTFRGRVQAVSGKPKPSPKKPKFFTGNASTSMDIKTFLKAVKDVINDDKYLPLTPLGAKEIIESIKGILHPLYIKITYEQLTCLEKVAKIRKLYESKDENPHIIFSDIGKVENIVPRFRILISSMRHKANFQVPLVKQANGIVIEIAEINSKLECNLLAMPPNDFNPNINHKEIKSCVSKGEYDIYEINDGTTFNIYYDPHYLNSEDVFTKEGDELVAYKKYSIGKWMRSTKNAFDVDELVWRGYQYKEIIDDVLSQYPKINDLDRILSYSVGFKHPS